jgi:hypothetical protein
MYNAYLDTDNPGAEIRINSDAAWRVYPDGREEALSPEDGETWFRRLRTDSRRAARNRRRGEIRELAARLDDGASIRRPTAADRKKRQAIIARSLTAFTEPQKNVLTLIGQGYAACLRPELDGALEDLIIAGLVTFRHPLTPAPVLTATGRSAFDRLD